MKLHDEVFQSQAAIFDLAIPGVQVLPFGPGYVFLTVKKMCKLHHGVKSEVKGQVAIHT